MSEGDMSPSPDVLFTLFDTVQIFRGGRPLDAGPRKQRNLLAALVLAESGWISRDRLIDCIWDDPAPDGAIQDFYRLVTDVRRLLTGAGLGAALTTKDGLYRLQLPAGSVDVQRFRTLIERAGQLAAEDNARAVDLLEEALGLAAGEPMADLTGMQMDAQRQRLVEERRAARLELERRSLQLGRHRARIPSLTAWWREDVGDQSVAGLLMIALHRSGRQTEAVRVFSKVREYLAETGGLDVSHELAELYRRMISNDPGLDVPDAAAEAPPGEAGETPRDDTDAKAKPRQETQTVRNDFHEVVYANGATFGISNHYHDGQGRG
jgi:DNA-binding SARP family transcriptional activator